MVPIQPSQAQAQRKNRRRERPGARKRHALALANEVAEGKDMALDHTPLPFQHSHLLSHAQARQHQYDRSWKAWKANEAIAEEMEKAEGRKEERSRQQEKEAYTRLFGGEADDDQPREFTISYASIKKSRQRHRITKPRVIPAMTMRTRRPALGFAMNLPLRPANMAKIEQLPLPAFSAETANTVTTRATENSASSQSLPPISNRGTSAFILPFHPAPSSVSTTNNTSQRQPHNSTNDSKS